MKIKWAGEIHIGLEMCLDKGQLGKDCLLSHLASVFHIQTWDVYWILSQEQCQTMALVDIGTK